MKSGKAPLLSKLDQPKLVRMKEIIVAANLAQPTSSGTILARQIDHSERVYLECMSILKKYFSSCIFLLAVLH